ncbi:caspase family protein [Methylobacterium sp. WSM2598]|uniref:caspase family protein n=1 Tax=Methylobacterium sp. WSM2598 TaxID=398261 RepID=UPI000564534C|nr:caspase family protein [Methylobacterium sp. WSM2598]
MRASRHPEGSVRRIGVWLVLWVCALLGSEAAAADRLAFVVGVDTYPNLGPGAALERPVADARAVGAALESIGFRVTLLTAGVTQETFLRRFSVFADQVQPGDTALFYFAGHGIALQGTNYLIPSDIPAIEPGQELLARNRALAEADLSAALRERGARVVVMVIDACRDNPFPRSGTRSVGLTRGLVRTEPAEGVFSLYAAGAGQQALDRLPGSDPSPNSVFTRVFVAQIRRPGVSLIDLGETVRDEVVRLAETVPHKQVPAYYNEVRGARFLSLSGSDPAPAEPPRPAPAPVPLPAPPPPLPAPVPSAGPAPPRVALPAPAPEPPREMRVGLFSHPIRLDPSGDNWLALRSRPSASEGVRLMKLGPDALFTVLGRQGAWLNVRLRGGETGWVHGDYVGCCRRAPVTP